MRERRQHIVYVTQHTEYHCRDRECVGVRDRKTGKWQRWHGVLRSRLVGSQQNSLKIARNVQLGARLVFVGDGTYLTSIVQEMARPTKAVVRSFAYANLTKSGAIENAR